MKTMFRKTSCLLICLLLINLLIPAQADAEASGLRLDMSSPTLKQEVTVKTFVDGDTTHFHVPESVHPSGVLKARYLAVDTPESTGRIEEYGKAASLYTRSKLESAVSIIVESDDAQWNIDSTGERYLVWVWYKTSESDEYRNLNVELLEQGLARANSSARNRYGTVCMDAIARGKEAKLHLHSGQKDPDFYYGNAVELTLRELRCSPESYNGVKVAFSGVITMNDGSSVYVESYDPETERWYGMSVYYGFNMNGSALDILSVGNESRIVGTLQYYEAGATWQVSGLTYRAVRPKDPGNIQKLSDGHSPAFAPVTPAMLQEEITVPLEDGKHTASAIELSLATSVSLQGLTVISAEAGMDEDHPSGMTLQCERDGVPIQLYLVSPPAVSPDSLAGCTVDARGIVDLHYGAYQIKVFLPGHLTIH